MTKQEQKSMLVVAALAFAGYTLWMRRQTPAVQLPGDVWGGGIGTQLPDVITDYFGGRSVSEVLANPGPLFQREVLDYRPEGLNYPAPAAGAGASGSW